MEKIIILIFSLLLIISCGEQNQEVKIIDSNLSNNKEKVEEVIGIKQKISWDDDVEFSHCENLLNYKGEKRREFFEKEDVKLLTKKIRNFESERNTLLPYGRFPGLLSEYCKTEDGNKFIFTAEAKVPTTLGIYDKELDLVEPTKLNNFVFKDLGKYIPYRNYGDISLEKNVGKYIESKGNLIGFGKRDGNIIEYKNYGVPLVGHAELAPGYFADKREYFSKSTVDYCDGGLTNGGKLSVCFADVFYDFDFIKNEITESRICSYYIDDNGKIKTLEKCFDINTSHKGYNLKSKSKGIDFYQNDSGNLSILEVDLNEAKISFDGTNSFYLKEEQRVGGTYYDDNGNIQVPALYDEKIIKKLDYEDENNKLDRFNRDYADEFIKKYDYKFIDKEVIAFVNGQFFNQNKLTTSLSFPVVSNGRIINSYVDNDIEKRTFVIDNNFNSSIVEGYNDYLLDKNYKELIVGFSPEVNARKDEQIGRTYIGLLDNKKVVFFIAKNKTQDEMNKITSDYGVESKKVIMMDGGPSSQFAYLENNGPGSEFERFYGKWEVPHFFVIYKD